MIVFSPNKAVSEMKKWLGGERGEIEKKRLRRT